MAKNRSKTHHNDKNTKSSKNNKNNKNKPSLNKQIMLIVVVGLLSAGILGGFGGSSDTSNDYKAQASSLNLPGYAYSSPITLKAYEYTALNPQIIDQVPCYCGCGGLGHMSLKNCFMTDAGEYDNHASQCDICVGEVIKIKKMYEDGSSLEEIRAKIDKEYSRYADPTGYREGAQITQAPAVDLSGLSLTEDFDSLTDGLKLTPSGITWARFINVKEIADTPLEQYAAGMVQPVGFYGTPLVAMYSADYSATSWIEMHDIGRTDITVQPQNGNGMKNIVIGRPFIYGHSGNVDLAVGLLAGSDTDRSSYSKYQSVLDAVDDESTSIASVSTEMNTFFDVSYTGLKALENGRIEKVTALHAIYEGAIPQSIYDAQKTGAARGFDEYDVTLENGILVIRMVSDLNTVLNENV